MIHIIESPEMLQLLSVKCLVGMIYDPLKLNLKTYVLVKCCFKRQGRCVDDQKSIPTIKIYGLTNIKRFNYENNQQDALYRLTF